MNLPIPTILSGTRACKYANIKVMKRVIDFLSEVKVELSKVVWPTPNQTFKLTAVVIIVTVTVGFFVGGVDFLLTKILEVILKK